MIRFTCSGCQRVVEVSDADAGLSMVCPTCGKSLRVPGSPPPAAGAGGAVAARPRLSPQTAPDPGMEAIGECPECGKALQVAPGDVGRRVACPRCAHQFIARGPKGAAPREEPREERRRDEEEARPAPKRREEKGEDDRGEREATGKKKYCTRCGAAMSRRERNCPECDAAQPEERDPALADANSKKVTAGVCALLFGGLGVHKFILGFTTAGVIMLLVTLLTCGVGGVVMHIISIVEGITYLTKSDEDFRRIYLVEKKEWF